MNVTALVFFVCAGTAALVYQRLKPRWRMPWLLVISAGFVVTSSWQFVLVLLVYSALFVALFVPWGSGWDFPLGWLLFWGKVLVMVLLVTAVAASHARYRIDQALRHFARLLALALGALVLAGYGW